jgi:WD40 repeat protein
VAFSADGKTIAAGYGANGGGVVLWDVATRQRLVTDPLTMQEGVVKGVALSPDGKTLAAGTDGGVVLWVVDRKSWQRTAGRIANRNLTWTEWQQYFPDEKTYHRTFRILPWPSSLPKEEKKKAEDWEWEHPAKGELAGE